MNKSKIKTQCKETKGGVEKMMKTLINQGKTYRGLDPRLILDFNDIVKSFDKNNIIENKK